MLSLRRWGAPQLLAAWIAYWVILAAVALGRPLFLINRVRALGEGRSLGNLRFGDEGFTGKIVADGATLWETQVPIGTVVAWIAIPPLLIWLAWLLARPRPTPSPDGPPPPPALRAADPVAGDARARERVGRERR
jgi:hypothetical protein